MSIPSQWDSICESRRATGRTTRMLAEAKRLADAGKIVYVVVASEQQVRELAVIADNRIHFEVIKHGRNPDWRSLMFRGPLSNCVVLVDHLAIQQEFEPLLEMFHRFDLPSKNSDIQWASNR